MNWEGRPGNILVRNASQNSLRTAGLRRSVALILDLAAGLKVIAQLDDSTQRRIGFIFHAVLRKRRYGACN